MMRLLRTVALFAVSAVTGALAAMRILLPPRKAPASEGPGAHKRAGLKRRASHIARLFGVFLVVLAIGGFLFAASGIYPIGASSGHWSIVRWFLNFSSTRAVETHTMGGTTPSLDDPALVLKGAGHYETGCRPCHGSPDLPYPRIAQQMTPHPPYLPEVVPDWEPDELFYIVKNGLKFTGMPAWPTRVRDDEVWAMVAFLLTLPDLNAEGYRRLVSGAIPEAGGTAPMEDLLEPEDAPPAIVESCGRCHGVDGLGRGTGAFPRLAGQRPTYLYASMVAYARGERHSGIMEPVAASLSREDMREIALYYASLEALPLLPAHEADAAEVERGRTIAHEGIPRKGVPSCVDCHGPAGRPRNPFYPALTGQYADYLVLQLELFKKGIRGGSAYAHLMHPVVDRLTEEEMRAVALYYASLDPGLDDPAQ